jgi:signal peptidase I
MLICPVCGFRNPQSNDRCIKCSALLHRDEEIINRAMYDGAEKARKQHWRDLVLAPVERLQRLLDFPGWRIKEALPYRFPFTAGGLSFIPGLGQLYNHQPRKGIIVGLAWAAFLAICLVTLRQPFSNVLLIVLVIGWMLIWNDAVGTAIRTNGQRWSLRNSLALLFGAMFLVGVTITALQFFGLSIVSLVRVRQDVQRPLIREGDRVWVNHTRYWFSWPKYGDVVFFDPPRFTAEQQANVYSINITSYFQRVIGIEGDHVEKKNGKFFRNGNELPPQQWPMGADTMPDFSFTVPRGKVMAPVTKVPQDTLGNLIGGALALGIGIIDHVGQEGYIFPKWEEATMISRSEIFGKAVAVVDPPEHRKWL